MFYCQAVLDTSVVAACAIAKVNPIELAWAAGFYDGEGSTFIHENRPGYLCLEVSVAQRGHGMIPAVLLRFQGAVLGMGRIDPPNEEGVHVWRSCGFEEAQATIALLWTRLGAVKRQQALHAMRVVRRQYETVLRARRSRRPPRPHDRHEYPAHANTTIDDLGRAWAAGFLDAEGCFGLIAAQPRKRGPRWYRIRTSATQHGEVGGAPEVLLRLKRVLGGIGRIESHGQPDDFKWLIEGASAVEAVLARTAPWLGIVKVEQARRALKGFTAQPRLKGDATRCLRGHLYQRVAMRGGRLRRICNACGRITARQRRAVQGIEPRQFKNVALGYTF